MVQVVYFARFREIAQKEREQINASTVPELISIAMGIYKFPGDFLVAVNFQYCSKLGVNEAGQQLVLCDTDEVCLVPPLSGG